MALLQPSGASANPPAKEAVHRVRCSTAVARALADNPLIHASNADVAGGEAVLRAEWGRYLPSLKARTLVTAIPSIRGDALNGYIDDSQWGAFFQLEADASMPLYAFGQLARLRAVARAGVDVFRADREVRRAEVAFQTRRAWWGWVFGQQVREVLREGRSYLDKARQRIEEQDEEDALDFDQVDLLKLRVHEAEMVDRELEVEAGILRAREGLKQAMALGVDVVLEAESTALDPIDLALASFEDLLAMARESRPEIQSARSALEEASHGVGAERGKLFPSLGVDGFYRYAKTDVADDQKSPFAHDPYNRHVGGVGLSLRWKLDLGQQLPAIGKAEARLARRQAELELAESDLVAQLRDVHHAITMWARLMKVERRAVRAARSWLVARSDMHTSGFGSLDQVADALVEFHTRRIAELNAIYEHNLAWMRLARVVGRDVGGASSCASVE